MTKNFQRSEIKAIIGLGNPGSRYTKTRHNIGFRVVDQLAQDLHTAPWLEQNNAHYVQVQIPAQGQTESAQVVYLVKPQTFMNNSGNVISFLQKKGIRAENILVVHDELEKAFGKISINFGGSAKGHNGLRSIINVIGKDFWRLRFGIGRPPDKQDVPHYVLAPFSKTEESELEVLISNAVHLILNS
ncbi:MAG: aminoacyl-tRNA hydrolase [Epsilonproteobacteria bacterium]|nr:aminoacyl-tRNA hydrolase [Campylobacterota bacterium]